MSVDGTDDSEYVGSDDLFDDEEDRTISFVDELCYRVDMFIIVFTLSLAFFIFGIVSLFVTEPGTGNRVMAVLNFFSTGLFSIGSFAIIVACKRRM